MSMQSEIKIDTAALAKALASLEAKTESKSAAASAAPAFNPSSVGGGFITSPSKSGKATANVSGAHAALGRARVGSTWTGKGKGRLEHVLYRVPISFSFTNSAANLQQTVTPIDVTQTSEWSAFQTLYDEYRFVRADLSFVAYAGANPSATSGGSDGLLCMAYDPVDNVVLSNSRNGAELSRFKLFSGTTGTADTLATSQNGKPWNFKFSCHKDEVLSITNSGTITSAPGTWKNLPGSGANAAYDGYIKTYWSNSNSGASAVTLAGIAEFYIEFRSRK